MRSIACTGSRFRRRPMLLIAGLALLNVAIGQAATQAAGEAIPDADALRKLALTVRLEADRRDASIRLIAERLERFADRHSPAHVKRHQRPFQEALLLVCDRDILPTLSRETRERMDEALERVLSFEAIRAGGWDRLAYVYGYFNHDVTPEKIASLAERWRGMPAEERREVYPTYPHLVDAVCKPLTVQGLGGEEATRRALEAALPLLKRMLLAEPAPGTAYHPPSHAALVLGPLWARWHDDPTQGPIVRKHLGDRAAFIDMLSGGLVGAQPEPEAFSDTAYGFYAYTGRYLANTLARLNARAAVPTLRRSLRVYREKNLSRSTIAYTRRALIALGDEKRRAELEATLKESPDDADTVDTLGWLCRNGRGETVEYARRLLAQSLGCEPEEALEVYFLRERRVLRSE